MKDASLSESWKIIVKSISAINTLWTVNVRPSSGCPYAERCKKTPHNRRISLNRELTKVHAEVIGRLTDTRGFLLRRNRAVQAEDTFGVMKNDREYGRIVRRGMDSVKMEVFLVSIGFNLYKYHRKQQAHMDMAA